MQTLKQEVIRAISSLPEATSIDEIMYRLYVIEKVRKGKRAVEDGKAVSVDELKREIESW